MGCCCRLSTDAESPLSGDLHSSTMATPSSSSHLRRQVVEIIGHVVVGEEPKQHLEYIIITQIGMKDSPDGAVCLVQRRFRDFDFLSKMLLPVAHKAGLSLPPLPSKLWGGGLLYAAKDVSPAFAARRQAALQRWLGLVTTQLSPWCETLRRFLGLAVSRDNGHESSGSPSNAIRWADISDLSRSGHPVSKPWMSPCSLAQRVLGRNIRTTETGTGVDGSDDGSGHHLREAGGQDCGASSSDGVGGASSGGGSGDDTSFFLPRGETEPDSGPTTRQAVTCLHVASDAWRAALIFPVGLPEGQAKVLQVSRGLAVPSPQAADGSALIVRWPSSSGSASADAAGDGAVASALVAGDGDTSNPDTSAAATPGAARASAKHHHRRALSEPPPADMLQAMRKRIQPPLPPPPTSPSSSQPASPNARSPSPSKRPLCAQDDERAGSSGGRTPGLSPGLSPGPPSPFVAGSPGRGGGLSTTAGFRLEPALHALYVATLLTLEQQILPAEPSWRPCLQIPRASIVLTWPGLESHLPMRQLLFAPRLHPLRSADVTRRQQRRGQLTQAETGVGHDE